MVTVTAIRVERVGNRSAIDLCKCAEGDTSPTEVKCGSYSNVIDPEMSVVPGPCPRALWKAYRDAVVNGEMKRDYAISAWCYDQTPKRKAARNARHSNREKFARKGLVAVGDGKHVHHVDGNPFNNDPRNLRVVSADAHRKLHSRAYRLRD